MYNILWIDDNWKAQKAFLRTCKREGMNISAYTTRIEGIRHLKDNLDVWDAVILDARMYDASEDESPSTSGMYKCREEIIRLQHKKHLPVFIFTGEEDLFNDDEFNNATAHKYFSKLRGEELIESLLDTLKNSDDAEIKNRFKDVFGALENFITDEEYYLQCTNTLVKLLKKAKHVKDCNSDVDYNDIRKVLECMLYSCVDHGIIPEILYNKTDSSKDEKNMSLAVGNCIHYLRGEKVKFVNVRYGNEGDRITPYYITSILFLLKSIGDTGSHAERGEPSPLTDYCLYSLAFGLCEVIMWFNKYLLDHPDKDENRKMCKIAY